MLSVYAILFFFWLVPDIGIFGGLTVCCVLMCCLPCLVPSCCLLYPLCSNLV